MRELVVSSGKGGTGKTSITAALSYLAQDKVICDADVDAADLHLILTPDTLKKSPFQGGHVAEIDQNDCVQCFICAHLCKFKAIDFQLKVNPINCEGCGICVNFCPEKAIKFHKRTCGEWYQSETRLGPMIHARLGVGEENSGKLVALVRNEAKKLSEKEGFNLIITDGPPGVGCPVISSITGANTLLIVTEPTVSGLHDLDRLFQLSKNFRLPCKICINKFDINETQTQNIETYAEKNGIDIVGKIPFDPIFVEAMLQQKTVFEYQPSSSICVSLEKMWDNLIRMPEMNIIDKIPAFE